jgi:1-deoxy-D-xylulose-5-phosphate reductoisomerase
LQIAQDVMHAGGLTGAVFNAAKERALDGFIAGDIGFMDMAPVVAETLNKMSSHRGLQNAQFTLDDVLNVDQLSRIASGEIISARR